MIEITRDLRIPEEELRFAAIRASGPGGQHVNKTASAVQLRFPVTTSPSLPEPVKERLLRREANRINREGELIINACSFRSQYRNRLDALKRLADCIRAAAATPAQRKKTRLPKKEKQKRRENKQHRSRIKELRRKIE